MFSLGFYKDSYICKKIYITYIYVKGMLSWFSWENMCISVFLKVRINGLLQTDSLVLFPRRISVTEEYGKIVGIFLKKKLKEIALVTNWNSRLSVYAPNVIPRFVFFPWTVIKYKNYLND